MRRATILAGALGALAVAFAARARQEPFPHGRHEGLFPLCDACHGDMRSGADAPAFPDPASCTRCHDGQREARVTWAGRSERPSNLRFSHGEHRDEAARAGDEVTCLQCHGTGQEGRMAVRPASAGSCLDCHAHEAPSHLAPGRDCLLCHTTLADASELPAERIARFSRPDSHEAEDFAGRHAPTEATAASCAVCHARESCTVCHANAASVPAIAALPPDARVAGLVRDKAPAYPAPASHLDAEWDVVHGMRAAESAATCANCHTRDGCAACHGAVGPAAMGELPVRVDGDARGVTIARRAAAVHTPGYAERHGTDAIARESSCTSCHDRDQCEACHTGGSTPSFHLPDYLARHGPAAYAADTECASCHSTEVFCRSCHDEIGLASRDRLGVAFHTANPFWLVGHGVAARQGLETCATCHAQQSCMRCHAATGSWRINPHGPGFDAARAQAANPVTCRLCHPAGSVR